MTAEHETDPKDLTAFQWDILWFLLGDGEKYGLGLKRDLGDYRGDEVNHGRLYPNLDRLADRDLVHKKELDKRTNGYSLTDAGRQVLEDRLAHVHAKAVNQNVIEHTDGGVSLSVRGD